MRVPARSSAPTPAAGRARQRAGSLLAAGLAAAVLPVAAPTALLAVAVAGVGTVTTDFAGSFDIANSVAVGGGKIVAAGSTGIPAPFALARYGMDGALDPTFGTGGRVTVSVGATFGSIEAVLVLPDGRVLAAGHRSELTSRRGTSDVVLARLRPNGTLDPTFGAGGLVITKFGAGALNQAYDLAVQPDGRILVAGYATGDFGLARFTADGAPDPTFGVGGKVVTGIGSLNDYPSTLLLQPDGRIVVGGRIQQNTADGGRDRAALARFGANGALDPTFGVGGKVVIRPSRDLDTDFEDLALTSDGRIVAAGWTLNRTANPGGNDVLLARYRADGSLDPTFGSGGLVQTDFGMQNESAKAVLVRPDNGVVVGGDTTPDGRLETTDLLLLGYRADGTLDPTFGTGGRTVTDVRGDYDQGHAAVFQGDRILLAGQAATTNPAADFALARYTAAGRLDPTFG